MLCFEKKLNVQHLLLNHWLYFFQRVNTEPEVSLGSMKLLIVDIYRGRLKMSVHLTISPESWLIITHEQSAQLQSLANAALCSLLDCCVVSGIFVHSSLKYAESLEQADDFFFLGHTVIPPQIFFSLYVRMKKTQHHLKSHRRFKTFF